MRGSLVVVHIKCNYWYVSSGLTEYQTLRRQEDPAFIIRNSNRLTINSCPAFICVKLLISRTWHHRDRGEIKILFWIIATGGVFWADRGKRVQNADGSSRIGQNVSRCRQKHTKRQIYKTSTTKDTIPFRTNTYY